MARFGDTSLQVADIQELLNFCRIADAGTLKELVTVVMSFETNLQTTTKIYFPYKVTVNKIRGIVMKAIAATDNGTITAANSTGGL